jgi:hypothetical protein
MRTLSLVCLLLASSAPYLPAQSSKPVIRVQKDGLPSGHATPEGAACDLARAFIRHDVALFKSICVKPYGGGTGRAQYSAFLQKTTQSMSAESKQPAPSPAGPKAIGIVFAARHLSKNGPVTYAHAVLGFKDVEFVDVGVFLHNGGRAMNRTLVLQASDGKWYVHPMPSASPLLSDGLNAEPNSTKEISDVYTIKPGS